MPSAGTGPRHAVVALTRGYDSLEKYDDLIDRNRAIDDRMASVSIPVDQVIFHEGNIPPDHQRHIQKQTPELALQFVDISAHAFLRDRESVTIYPPSRQWGMGYRHMCAFWFVDFWAFVAPYDRILRIDEDCVIQFDIERVLNSLDGRAAVYGKWWYKDSDMVIAGLNPLTLWFLKQRGRKEEPRVVGGPYTNVIALNLARLRQSELLMQYIELVRESGGIHSHRWGDLPLWGEVLEYFFQRQDRLLDREIAYFHGSHQRNINL